MPNAGDIESYRLGSGVMTALNIEISEQDLQQLRERAEQLGLSIHDLARASILDLIRTRDADFEAAAARVLEKNAELYRRLA